MQRIIVQFERNEMGVLGARSNAAVLTWEEVKANNYRCSPSITLVHVHFSVAFLGAQADMMDFSGRLVPSGGKIAGDQECV